MLLRATLLTLVAAAWIACGQEPGDVEEGRSDFVHASGSCAGACGGEADDGGCYCDDACTRFADCCGDKEEHCPHAPLLDEYILPGRDLFPEGGTFDPVSRSFFVGSIPHGSITAVHADGAIEPFFAGAAGRSTLGMKVDVDRRRLWVCAADRVHDTSGIWVFDIDTRERLHAISLASLHPRAACNDLALDAAGRAYITDFQHPHVYLLDIDRGELRMFADHPLLKPQLRGLNGVAVTPDGRSLLVTKYLPARLIRIAIDDPSQVTEVRVTGDGFKGGGLISGADGMVFLGDDLYVVFVQDVFRVRPDDANWSSARSRRKPLISQLSAITVAEEELYVVKSEVVHYVLAESLPLIGGLIRPRLPFKILRVDPAAF